MRSQTTLLSPRQLPTSLRPYDFNYLPTSGTIIPPSSSTPFFRHRQHICHYLHALISSRSTSRSPNHQHLHAITAEGHQFRALRLPTQNKLTMPNSRSMSVNFRKFIFRIRQNYRYRSQIERLYYKICHRLPSTSIESQPSEQGQPSHASHHNKTKQNSKID